MKYYCLLFCFLLVLSCDTNTVTVSSYPNSEFFDHDWAMDPLWEDGQAEVAHYSAERIVYGKVRNYEYAFITVKEEFNQEFNVKTDDYSRDDLFSVMKVNKFASFETENYPYHYLTSLFFKRDQPEQLHKMTHTGQEWCGNTFKQFSLNSDSYHYDYNSYFDGYGDGERVLQGSQMLWEDQLSYVLRSLKFEDGLSFEKPVIGSQINTKVYEPTIYQAQLKVNDIDSAWQVIVELDEQKTNSYLFEKEYPNLMLLKKGWDGFNLELDSVSRYQYWR